MYEKIKKRDMLCPKKMLQNYEDILFYHGPEFRTVVCN